MHVIGCLFREKRRLLQERRSCEVELELREFMAYSHTAYDVCTLTYTAYRHDIWACIYALGRRLSEDPLTDTTISLNDLQDRFVF